MIEFNNYGGGKIDFSTILSCIYFKQYTLDGQVSPYNTQTLYIEEVSCNLEISTEYVNANNDTLKMSKLRTELYKYEDFYNKAFDQGKKELQQQFKTLLGG